MAPYCHLADYLTVVWMKRNLDDILRSQQRIGWEQHEHSLNAIATSTIRTSRRP